MRLKGKLLVAPPGKKSQFWHKTVILIHEENKHQTFGIILNHKTGCLLSSVAEYHNLKYNNNTKVYTGGSDNETALLMLHTSEWKGDNTLLMSRRVSMTSDDYMIDRLCENDTPKKWRVFLGMCEWKTAELHAELNSNDPSDWLICSANENILFDSKPLIQWERAIELAIQENSNKVFSIDKYIK